jgi:acetylornithine deacetylase/succinyl-diaminopimelate desuccinylase-like protein
MITRGAAIARALEWFDSGGLRDTLARRVAYRTESQRPDRRAELAAYLEDGLAPALAAMGFAWRLVDDEGSPAPFLIAERIEDPALTTVLSYGHGDVAGRPTLFLGSRGAFNFDLTVRLRDGAHHSGNWGGLLANPATILANAIASLVDARGRIVIDALRTPPIPASVAEALAIMTGLWYDLGESVAA